MVNILDFIRYIHNKFLRFTYINCAGNGGALAVNSEKVLSEAKLLRSWGRSSSLFDAESESIENDSILL